VNLCPVQLCGFFPLVAAIIGLGTSPCEAQPANDLFAFRTLISGTNVSVAGSNVEGTRETGEPYHAGKLGGASVWWSWRAPMDGWVTFSTAGSSFDTLLGVYTGLSVAALTEAGGNDDEDYEAGIRTSKVVVDVRSNQVCQIAVDGYFGVWGTVKLSAAYTPPEPAPAWTSPDPYGGAVHSTNYAGKVVLLSFWTTWCSDCRLEIPDLVALQEKYRTDGLVVLGANTGANGDTPAAVQTFLLSFSPSINYQVVMASLTMMQDFGGTSILPTTFIIDRQNLIQKKYVGSQGFETLQTQIIPLLYDDIRLSSRWHDNQVELSWPIPGNAFSLEYNTNLAGTNWAAWPTPPVVVNGTNIVSVPPEGPERYFRLHLAH
jgi:thiol-disulfide isomerase/thioredoxin